MYVHSHYCAFLTCVYSFLAFPVLFISYSLNYNITDGSQAKIETKIFVIKVIRLTPLEVVFYFLHLVNTREFEV